MIYTKKQTILINNLLDQLHISSVDFVEALTLLLHHNSKVINKDKDENVKESLESLEIKIKTLTKKLKNNQK